MTREAVSCARALRRTRTTAAVVIAAALVFSPGCGRGRASKPSEVIPGGGAIEQVLPGGEVDRAIRATIEMSLRTDPRTQRSPISVAVTGRVVTLSGTAVGLETKSAAIELARKTPQVTQVQDKMSVAPAGLP